MNATSIDSDGYRAPGSRYDPISEAEQDAARYDSLAKYKDEADDLQ